MPTLRLVHLPPIPFWSGLCRGLQTLDSQTESWVFPSQRSEPGYMLGLSQDLFPHPSSEGTRSSLASFLWSSCEGS